MHYICVKSLFVAMQLTPTFMVIITNSIATFSNCTVNKPIKMHSCISATIYDIIPNKCALVLNGMHVNKLIWQQDMLRLK